MIKKYLSLFFIPIAGLGSIACYRFLAIQKDLRANIPQFLIVYTLLFLIYIITLLLAQKQDKFKKQTIILLVGFAISFRIFLLPSAPTLSNDIYRYLWDGKLTSSGIDPYIRPDSTELLHMQDKIYSQMDHKDCISIYPPITQLIFMITYKLKPTVSMMKFIFVIFDIGTIFLLYLLLKALKKEPHNIVIYAWNPLVVIEVAGSGHLEPFAIFWLILALLLYYKKENLQSSLAMVVSILAKLITLPLLALLSLRIGRKKTFCAIIFAIICYLPFIKEWKNILAGLSYFFGLWEFNGSVFSVILSITGSYVASKIVLTVLALSLLIYLSLKKVDLLKSCYLMLGLILVLSPVVHPWYLLWIIPFICIYQNTAWLTFTFTVAFSYSILTQYYYQGAWEENTQVKLLVYLPFYLLLVVNCCRKGFHFFKARGTLVSR
ncbi:hypothetical protein ACFL0T_08000 [Candidatus Omnitrophota bacterium]